MSDNVSRRGIHVVHTRRSKNFSSSRRFCAGEAIPASGIYRVFHSIHRVSHDLTLLEGEVFPPCNRCGEKVHFKLLRKVPEITADYDFRIRLYEIPHPEDKEEAVEETA